MSERHHVTGLAVYLAVFLALMVFTAVTVWASFVHLGPFNDLVAMAIAFTKATLVVLFFMQVRHASRMAKITVVAGFLWLAILFGITLTDYFSRGFLG
ncbi:MAG: cytochrome C oxidase subunit IV family protein [Acidobacteriota bacterium]|nr:cytochrome C oxidase subunit IV family protein [Acidobacteriota bacterium]MDH3523957.1 cytochrome C oxidase subunit IV family protein [Acidobacteriota bacterium]